MEVGMTREEHELMVAMLAKQRQFTQLLLNILIENKIVTKDILPAFDVSVGPESVTKGDMYQGTWNSYKQAAEALKIPNVPLIQR